jgi:hypothetical protein
MSVPWFDSVSESCTDSRSLKAKQEQIVSTVIMEKNMVMTNENENLHDCIEACEEALHACQECAAADIREGGHTQCALINLDCADICAATLKALARKSEHHGDFCAICAHLCRKCAEACALHADKHEHCARCQQACEACAIACEKHAKERDM